MPVELPEVLSVLAHELRSPLSVLQGYIRLLQRQADPAGSEAAMLKSMLDASARLTALGRQTSDMAAWLRRDESTTPTAAVPLAEFERELVRRAPPGVTASADSTRADAAVYTPDVTALADACVALAQFAMRETAQQSAALTLSATPGGVHLRVETGTPSTAAPVDTPVPFARGGLGLVLVTASYVLSAHGATVTATPTFDRVEVGFPMQPGEPT